MSPRHAGPPPSTSKASRGVTRRHRPSDFYHERTNFQFIKHTKRWPILSGTLILISFDRAVRVRGLNFGIDFKGGTSWQVHMANGRTAHVTEVRDLLAPLEHQRLEGHASLSGRPARASTCRRTWSTTRSRPSTTCSRPTAASPPARSAVPAGRQTGGGTFTVTAAKGVTPTESRA